METRMDFSPDRVLVDDEIIGLMADCGPRQRGIKRTLERYRVLSADAAILRRAEEGLLSIEPKQEAPLVEAKTLTTREKSETDALKNLKELRTELMAKFRHDHTGTGAEVAREIRFVIWDEHYLLSGDGHGGFGRDSED